MASTWGEPEISNSSPMQGPQQISDVADFAMARGIRHFDTVALLKAASGALVDYYAVVAAAPGALWRYNGSAWSMVGVARFATVTDAANGIPVPEQGMRRRIATNAYTEEYFALYNATTNPVGASPAGWYPVEGVMPGGMVERNPAVAGSFAAGYVALNNNVGGYWLTPQRATGLAAFDATPSDARWVVPFAGVWEVELGLDATASSAALIPGIWVNAVPASATGLVAWHAAGSPSAQAIPGTVRRRINLAAGDIVRAGAYSTNPASWNQTRASWFGIRFVEPTRA